MAQPAAEDWIALLARAPGRTEFAGRQALICSLTALLAQLYQTPEPALTVYIVFFLNKADRASSVVTSTILLVLASIIIALVTLTAMFVIDDPPLRVAAMAALSFGILFFTSTSKLRPIGPTIALIVGYALDLLGTFHSGEVAVRALLYAWLFVATPAAVSVAVNLLIAPAPRRLVERAIAERLSAGAALLRSADSRTRASFAAFLDQGTESIGSGLKLAGAERSSAPGELEALRSAMEASTSILLLVELLSDPSDAALPASLRVRLARTLDQIACFVRRGAYPFEIVFEHSEDEQLLSPVSVALMAEFRDAVCGFASARGDSAVSQTTARTATAHSPRFLLPDAFSNPEHVQYALKTTAAAMFCYCIYTMLDWPSIHTCFITCYVVALSTTAEAIEKLTLRIVGCLVGAALGIVAIVFVVPRMTSIGELMSLVFLGAFVAAWVAAGSPRIAYSGFQIAFAFFLCVIQGPAPAFDLVIARDRVIGILIGILVAYIAFTCLWPVSVAWRIDQTISSTLRSMLMLVQAPMSGVRRGLSADILAARVALKRDLLLIGYEPRWLRPTPDWLLNRSKICHALVALHAPLLLVSDRNPELSVIFARRLDRLIRDFPQSGRSAIGRPMEHEPARDAPPPGLWSLIDSPLSALECGVVQSNLLEGPVGYAQV
jgi:multidrug resistance protein MdtO